jgi:hypothetical protein
MSNKCLDCKIDTLEIGEYYMVENELWKVANPKVEGMLCIGCLEKRLSRKLKCEDFLKCPLNYINMFNDSSDRLVNRLTNGIISW